MSRNYIVPLNNTTQLQIPDYGQAFSQGIQSGVQLRTARLAEQQALRQEQAQAAKNELIGLASSGDPQALSRLAGVDPQAAKGIQENMQRKVLRGAQLANSVIGDDVDQAKKPILYKQALRAAELEGLDISQLPAEYSEEAEVILQGIRNQGRDLEKMIQQQLEAPQRQATLESTKASTAKTYQDIASQRAEAAAAAKEGLSLEAYKAKQQKYGGLVGESQAQKEGLVPKKPLSGEAAKVTTIASDGLNSIQNVRDLLYEKGKLSSKSDKIIGGATFLPNILQREDQQKFETARQNLADLIGRLRSGGAINKDEEKRFLNLMPKFGDKQGTIDFKLKQLERNFGKLQEGITGESPKPATSGSVGGVSWRLK